MIARLHHHLRTVVRILRAPWRMPIQCCYCRADLGTKPCCLRQSGLTSHGICSECYAIALSEFRGPRTPNATDLL